MNYRDNGQSAFVIDSLKTAGCPARKGEDLYYLNSLTNGAKGAELRFGGAMSTGPSTGAEICVRGVRTRIFKISL
jgi:hypothetical protein